MYQSGQKNTFKIKYLTNSKDEHLLVFCLLSNFCQFMVLLLLSYRFYLSGDTTLITSYIAVIIHLSFAVSLIMVYIFILIYM